MSETVPIPFTAAQLAIYRMIVDEGLSIDEICSRTRLSPNTVKTQTKRIFDKAGVDSRLQLAVFHHTGKISGKMLDAAWLRIREAQRVMDECTRVIRECEKRMLSFGSENHG